jgi:hypothetical protein
MKKDTQKRLLTVAHVLNKVGQDLVTADQEKSLWRKFFTSKDAPAEKPTEKPEKLSPEEFLKQQQEIDDLGNIPAKKERPKMQNQKPPVLVTEPKPQVSPAVIKDFADFVNGRGMVPFEISKPLKQISDYLAASGAASVKDASNVTKFLVKMLQKYLGGQKLAKSTVDRKKRIAAAEVPEVCKKYLINSK